MSYCHDILLDKEFDRAAFAAAARDVRTLIRRAEVKVVGPSGRPNSLPIVEAESIEFNGVNRNCVCGLTEPDDEVLCLPPCGNIYLNPSDTGQPFSVDVRRKQPLNWNLKRENRYWFDCKTNRKPYDKIVKMSMIALKHHLGDSITLHSKGNWAFHWGAGYELAGRPPKRDRGGAVEVYEHVFPDRAPVQNILASESIGF